MDIIINNENEQRRCVEMDEMTDNCGPLSSFLRTHLNNNNNNNNNNTLEIGTAKKSNDKENERLLVYRSLFDG